MRIQEFRSLLEQQLDELKMSPSSLNAFADSDAAKGIMAGFEAELVFRGMGESESEELEPDMDADERAYSIQSVIDFFENDDWGYGISNREASNVESELDDMYMEWRDDQILNDFKHDSEDLISDLWLEERPMTERIHDALTSGLELSDDEADAVIVLHARRERGEISGSDMSEDELEMESKYSEAKSIAMDILEEDVQGSIDDHDDKYDQALENYRDNYSGDDDSFFSDVGLRWMSDIAEHFGLMWPYMTGTGEGGEGGYSEGSADRLADSLEKALGVKTKVSTGYHSASRDAHSWIFEPDSSLSADEYDDMPVEIITPPMPLNECLKKMEDFFAWAESEGAYANKSTGFHMGVSLPIRGGDVDYVKLALFLGDEHVLQSFGRSGNTYCEAAMKKIRNRIGNDRGPAVANAMDLMRHNLIELAQKSLAVSNISGFGKYTSINPQGGYDSRDPSKRRGSKYIEFRSAGGKNYFEDIDRLKNTLLRYAQAMAVAGDASAYRNEYYKKLYKLIAPATGDVALDLFSRYNAGTINLSELKKSWAEKALEKERSKPGDEREWEAYNPTTGEVLGSTQDASLTNATNYFRDTLKLDRFQVREREPELKSSRAKLAKRITAPKPHPEDQGTKQIWIVSSRGDSHVEEVYANDEAEAIQLARQQHEMWEHRSDSDLTAVLSTEQNDVRTIPRKWEFYRAETGNVIDAVDNINMMQAESVRRDIVRRYGHPNASVRMRSVPTAASAERARARATLGEPRPAFADVQDLEPNVAQNFAEPQNQQMTVQGVPNWEIYNVNTNQVMRTFFQRDYRDAMVYAGQWLEANEFGLEGYGVRPTMETP